MRVVADQYVGGPPHWKCGPSSKCVIYDTDTTDIASCRVGDHVSAPWRMRRRMKAQYNRSLVATIGEL